MPNRSPISLPDRDAIQLACLLLFFTAATIFSLKIAYRPAGRVSPEFWNALWPSFALLLFIPLFIKARFSFGFFVCVCFLSMIVGFFWLSYFSNREYDHVVARWSAWLSLLLFMLPVLFQRHGFSRKIELSCAGVERLVFGLLGLALAALILGASYGIAIVGLDQSEFFRSAFERPVTLNYAIGSITNAALPFCFAYFASRGRFIWAFCSLMLLIAFYPIVLNKSVVFGAVLLPFLFVLFNYFDPKRAAILALLIPMLSGIAAYSLFNSGAVTEHSTAGHLVMFWYGNVNTRLFGYPSIAMDVYSDFFTKHAPTHFCQIGIIRAAVGCPYPFQLGAVMAQTYDMGNFNGSLFATEGIASVGPIWAPLSALVCGTIVSIGNSASARLPARLVGTSAGIVVAQTLMNAPLSVSLLSNGLMALWMLWTVTPGTIFGDDCSGV